MRRVVRADLQGLGVSRGSDDGMFNDVDNVLKLIAATDRVLDVGGGIHPFPRADAVLDVVPYEAYLGALAAGQSPRVPRDQWFTGDICHPAVWAAVPDRSYDFVICSHTLEDVRDPLFVCGQLQRVARQGYIETPAKFRECAKVDASHIVAGWEHHRWIVDIQDDTLLFTMKNPLIHHFDFAGTKHRDRVFDYFLQFIALHWIESFDFAERSQKGSPIETADLERYYRDFEYGQPLSASAPPVFHTLDRRPFRGRTLRHTHEFQLPIEAQLTHAQILEQYKAKLARDGASDRPPTPPLRVRLRAAARRLLRG